ncbi:MAG: DUF4097 family beta strand repeat protein [Oligoflexia bacterium]|nr:DUF4097 family beta strand repeat protein [Oligoflexia bacterium]
MKYKVIILNFLILIPTLGFAEQISKIFEADKIKKIEVSNGSGKVNIVATKEKQATVVADKIRTSEKCQIIIDLKGDLLITKTESERGDCEINFSIIAPGIAQVDVEIGSGDLDVSNMQGATAFKTGSGDININNSGKRVSGKTGSGDISINGVLTSGDISTGSGDIKINFPALPEKGELEVRTGSGDAILSFPEGSSIETSLKSGSGGIHNEIGDSDNGKLKISMKSGSGDIKIKNLKKQVQYFGLK